MVSTFKQCVRLLKEARPLQSVVLLGLLTGYKRISMPASVMRCLAC